jgi:hypothetical protein
MRRRLWKHAWLLVTVATFAVLAFHPIPECFDCDSPNPWGRDDQAYERDSGLLAGWLISVSFLSGIFRLRRGWLVPLGVVAAHVCTQPFGGVPISSVINDTAPELVVLGLAIGFSALACGRLVAALVTKMLPTLAPVSARRADGSQNGRRHRTPR